MITNKHKLILGLLSLISTFVAVIVILPFNVLFDRLGIVSKNMQLIELIIKLIIIPLIVVGLSVYPVLLRRNNYYTQLDVSVSATKMSFIPAAMYFSAITGWIGGVIHASISPLDTKYLILVSVLWSSSVIVMVLFGIFTKWIHNLTGKQMLLANVLSLIVLIMTTTLCFMIHKSLPTIVGVSENNAFLQILLFVCMFMVSLLSLCKSIFSDQSERVVLEKDEYFTEEEISELIIESLDIEIQDCFDQYIMENKGKYIENMLSEEKMEEQ